MPIQTQTFPPAPGGMNVAYAPQEIDDTEARYIQDALLDLPGVMRRRGPLKPAVGVATLPRPASGFAVTVNPRGDNRYAALTGDNSNGYLSVLADNKASWIDLTWPHALPTNPAGSSGTRYRLVDAKPSIGGGAWIGTASDYGPNGSLHALAFWRGGNKPDYSTGTVSLTQGSTAVTGSGTSFTANVAPGMFLFADTNDPYTQTYIGVVLSVNSNTSITLEKPSPFSATSKPYVLTSIRGFMPQVTKGRITCATDSPTVSGGKTKFKSQGLGTGAWHLFRASDMAHIGKVSSVASEISLTLTGNAAIALADEAYVAIRADWATADKSIDITGSPNKVGWMSATYAERQWYANNGAQFDKTFRLWFSDLNNPEAVDLSADGDWIPITTTTDVSEPIRGLMPTYNALLVFKDTETFAVYGTSPESFSSKKLEDDGLLSTMAVQPYGGGAIWPGRFGVYFYNGVQAENLTASKLGDVYKNTVRTMDTLRYRAWSMVAHNHYFLFFESLEPTITLTKGTVTDTPNSWVLVINMDTRAIVLHTNIHIRGSIQLPDTEGRGTWFLVNNNSGTATVIDAERIFSEEGTDTVIPAGGAAGPDFFWETKKFNAGEDLRLKRFKQAAAHYLAQGGAIKADTVLGLNNLGRALTTDLDASVPSWSTLGTTFTSWDQVPNQFPAWSDMVQGVFEPKRLRFLKKSHHMALRFYQEHSNIVRLRMGPIQVGFKYMRPGRV